MEHIHYRMIAYVLTIVMHIGNFVYLYVTLIPAVLHPDILPLQNVQRRFFTIWTAIIQILYAFVCLISDTLELSNYEIDEKFSKYFRRFRNTLFSSILWPSIWVVAVVFWTLTSYDKALVFPKHTAELLNPVSNHIMHTVIVPLAIWELMYRERRHPRSHWNYLYHMAFYFAMYFVVIIYTFITEGIWIYPVFSKLYGTIYFPLIHTAIFTLAISAYFLQWRLTGYIWRETNVKKVS